MFLELTDHCFLSDLQFLFLYYCLCFTFVFLNTTKRSCISISLRPVFLLLLCISAKHLEPPSLCVFFLGIFWQSVAVCAVCTITALFSCEVNMHSVLPHWALISRVWQSRGIAGSVNLLDDDWYSGEPVLGLSAVRHTWLLSENVMIGPIPSQNVFWMARLQESCVWSWDGVQNL